MKRKTKRKRKKVTLKARIVKACSPYVDEIHKLRKELNSLKHG